MRTLLRRTLGLFACCALALSEGCGGSTASPPDAGADAGPDGGGCYTNPKTSLELLNGCTDAGFIDKAPALPLLLPDGGLPPLP